MTIRIDKPVQGGTVRAIASKSEAQRLLICAALASGSMDRECFIVCPQRSEDIDAAVRCLMALGAELRYEDEGFYIRPIDRRIDRLIGQKKSYVLDCGESGATLRFLLPICGALGYSVTFNMSGRLPSRPLSTLRDEMTSHGCTLAMKDDTTLACEGRLIYGTYTLPGNISSQFVSGLLFALPQLNGESIIRIAGVLQSRPYVDMTLDALGLFGVKILEEEASVFRIPGRQTSSSPVKVKVSGDWSNAAFWLSAGAIGKSVTCTDLDQNSRQGDRAIVELLKRFGARVTCNQDTVTISPAPLNGIEIDAKDIPDLVPVLAAVASVAHGKTVIRKAGSLRIKESDRLRTIAMSLSALGADIKETEDGLEITGRKSLKGGETPSYQDHRIAMAAAVLSAACTGPVVIQNAEAVRKSYPGFFEDFCALGGRYEHLR